MHKMTMDYILKKGSEILNLCYNKDINFPRSCGIVSSFMAYNLFKNEEIRDVYTVNYIRGHYMNNNEEDDCPYLDVSYDDFSECIDCSCDFMVAHSWVELVDNKTNEIHIVDLTSSQFSEKIGDLEVFLMENKGLDNSELIYALSEYGTFSLDINAKNYIKTSNSVPGENIFNTINNTISKEEITIHQFWKSKILLPF